MESSDKLSMEKILKKVYDVHRQIVTETSANLTKYKGSHARLVEKAKQLETEKANLLSENRSLQAAVNSCKDRSGSCCEAIRETLQTVITSYTQLLHQKDATIRQLEEELKQRRGSLTTDCLEHTPVRVRDSGDQGAERKAQLSEQSPDSTCLAIPTQSADTPSHTLATPTRSADTPSHTLATPTRAADAPSHTQSLNDADLVSKHSKSSASQLSSKTTKHVNTSRLSKLSHIRDRLGKPSPQKERTNKPSPRKERTSKSSPSKESLSKLSPSKDRTSKKGSEAAEAKVGDDEDADDLVFDEALEMVETGKSRLQKRRNKRSRFSEEVSPEVKRQRQTSPGTSSAPTSNIKHTASRNPAILVPDTCALDVSITVHNSSKACVQDKRGKHSTSKDKVQEDFSQMVIPETLAMDADSDLTDLSSEEEEDTQVTMTTGDTKQGEKGKAFRPDLSDITELSVENSRTDSVREKSSLKSNKLAEVSAKEKGKVNANDTGKNRKNKEIGDSSALNDDDDDAYGNGNDDGEATDLKRSLRSLLDSPESGKGGDSDDDVGIINAVNHHTLNLSGSSAYMDSDEDDLEDTLKNEISQVSRGHSRSSQARKMKEINDMFETPDKSKDVKVLGNKDEKQRNMLKTKPIFKKAVTRVESDEETVLRRSPRKHSKVYRSDLSCRRNKSFDSGNHGDSRHGYQSQSSCDTGGQRSPESQSLDMYNVVPMKNGIPVTNKMFQVKVSKSSKEGSKDTEEVGRSNLKAFQSPRKNSNSTRKNRNDSIASPSILDLDAGSRVTGVINLCSPSIGSASDAESPLLLQNSGKTANRSQHSSKERKSTPSKKSKREEMAGDGWDSTKARAGRSMPRRAASQMTLTQGFFSPKKKSGKKKHVDEDRDLQKALELSLEEAGEQVGRNAGSKRGETADKQKEFSFKKPTLPQKTEKHSKARKVVSVQPCDDLDETVAPESQSLSLIGDGQTGNQRGVNGSLDPAADLTMWCGEPDSVEEDMDGVSAPAQTPQTLPSLDLDFREEDLASGEDSLQRTSTLVAEDSQDMPSTAASYKFQPRRKRLANSGDKENLDPKQSSQSKSTSNLLDDSFDRPPKKTESKVAHVAVVRKQDERQKLQGHGCKQCLDYYTAAGLDEEEIRQHMQHCSRHRAEFAPPDTPPHFWSVGFIDTQECVDRGYLKVEKSAKATAEDKPKFRRRRQLTKCFKSKNETSTMEPDSQDS